MADATASERAYQRVKADILSGSLAVGPIDTRLLSDRLRMSVTPVREALSRLIAEKLVRLAPHQCYLVVTPGATRLEHLYELSGSLLNLTLERQNRPGRTRSRQPQTLPLTGAYAADLALLFGSIAAAQPNLALAETVMALTDQLHSARRCEPRVFPEIGQELAELVALWVNGNLGDLRLRLRDHHRTRLFKVDAISRLVFEEAGGD